MRDRQLDIYRALVMTYILCVIHVVWWLGYKFEPYHYLLLWEMPAIFFIAGASSSFTSKKSVFRQFLNRARRVILPYYIYALVCIVILIIVSHTPPLLKINKLTDYPAFNYSLIDCLSVLLGRKLPGIPYTYHLWFILPYLFITVSFSLQRLLVDKIKTCYIIANVLIFIILDILKSSGILIPGFLMTFLAYNIFFVAGYLYYKRLTNRKLATIMLISFALFLVLSKGHIPNMQALKFPPTTTFVVYGVFILCLFSLILKRISLKGNALIDRWNKHGYTIYLYQNLIFGLYAMTLNRFVCILPCHVLVKLIISGVVIFILSTLASYITVPIEQFAMRKLTGKP